MTGRIKCHECTYLIRDRTSGANGRRGKLPARYLHLSSKHTLALCLPHRTCSATGKQETRRKTKRTCRRGRNTRQHPAPGRKPVGLRVLARPTINAFQLLPQSLGDAPQRCRERCVRYDPAECARHGLLTVAGGGPTSAERSRSLWATFTQLFQSTSVLIFFPFFSKMTVLVKK